MLAALLLYMLEQTQVPIVAALTVLFLLVCYLRQTQEAAAAVGTLAHMRALQFPPPPFVAALTRPTACGWP